MEWMTVAENVALAQGFPRGAASGRSTGGATDRAARAALATVGCDIDPDTRVQALARTEKSLVAIARALATDCDFLVLDEPTASLPANEVERLFAVMRALKARGVGMIYVSHRLDEMFRVADRVVVLRDGAKVGDGAGGRHHARGAGAPDRRALDLRRLRQGGAADRRRCGSRSRGLRTAGAGPVDFDAARQRAARARRACAAPGRRRSGARCSAPLPHEGAVRARRARRSRSTQPFAALRPGRRADGARPRRGVGGRRRSACARTPSSTRPPPGARLLRAALAAARGARAPPRSAARVNLRPNAPELPIEALSGGNQQKVVVARWLATGRRLLICRGSDRRRRRRRQGRDLRADRAGARPGARGDRDLDRLRGGGADLPPGAGLQPRPRSSASSPGRRSPPRR